MPPKRKILSSFVAFDVLYRPAATIEQLGGDWYDIFMLPDGRVVEPSMLVGPKRPGRKVVLTGDTRPCQATIDIARGADLLIHEATFGDEEAARAVETGHSTAREAAIVARDAGVASLVLFHFSARYSRDASELGKEARQCFERTIVGRDGMEVDVAYEHSDVPTALPSVS